MKGRRNKKGPGKVMNLANLDLDTLRTLVVAKGDRPV